MVRLFAGKKDTKDQHIDVSINKKRFGLFRRGNSEKAVVVTPSESDRASPERKTKSYRISVYEVRNGSPTPTCNSSTEEDDGSGQMGRFERSTSHPRSLDPPKRRTAEISRHRSRSPMKRRRSTTPSNGENIESLDIESSTTRRTPRRTISDTRVATQTGSNAISPQRGILKKATFSMGDKPSQTPKDQSIPSFDLEVARTATSLTDNMSTESSKDRQLDVGGTINDYPLDGRNNSFVISPKRGVSFSKDTMAPKPKPSGAASIFFGTPSGKRVVCFVFSRESRTACMRTRLLI